MLRYFDRCNFYATHIMGPMSMHAILCIDQSLVYLFEKHMTIFFLGILGLCSEKTVYRMQMQHLFCRYYFEELYVSNCQSL